MNTDVEVRAYLVVTECGNASLKLKKNCFMK